MACRSGCRTQDHRSYHECLRAASTRIAYAGRNGGGDYTEQKKWDQELDLYRKVRKEGIQPDGTKMHKIVDAMRQSDQAGAAYGRDFNRADPME